MSKRRREIKGVWFSSDLCRFNAQSISPYVRTRDLEQKQTYEGLQERMDYKGGHLVMQRGKGEGREQLGKYEPKLK